mgnify:FL=1
MNILDLTDEYEETRIVSDKSKPSVYFYAYRWSIGSKIKGLDEEEELNEYYVYTGIGTSAEACVDSVSNAIKYVMSKVVNNAFVKNLKTKITMCSCWSDIPVDKSKEGMFDVDGKFKLFSEFN